MKNNSLSNPRGQGLAEYIIIVILVAVGVIVALRYFGSGIWGRFTDATEEIKSVGQDSDSGKKVEDGGAKPGQSGTDTSAPGVAAGSETSAATTAKGQGATEGQDELDKRVASLHRGVGDSSDVTVEKIKLDWPTLIAIAGVVVGIGVFIVFRRSKKQSQDSGKKSKKKKFSLTNKISDESGQAIVEFSLSAISFLFVILGVMQLALALNAYSLVRYAAYNAARAAIVHGGDQQKMEEAARLSLLATFPRHGRADHVRGIMENYLSAKATDSDPAFSFFGEPITKVEILNTNDLPPGTVITFDDPRNANRGVITVKVTHYYELVIPLVNRIIFYIYTKIRSGEGYQGETVDRLASLTDTARRTGNFVDIEYRMPLVGYYTMRLQSDYVVN